MGWLFRTPGDDATEATLRALHTQNIVDTVYERTWGWFKVFLFTSIGVFTISAIEHYSDVSLWEGTVEWARLKLMGMLGL